MAKQNQQLDPVGSGTPHSAAVRLAPPSLEDYRQKPAQKPAQKPVDSVLYPGLQEMEDYRFDPTYDPTDIGTVFPGAEDASAPFVEDFRPPDIEQAPLGSPTATVAPPPGKPAETATAEDFAQLVDIKDEELDSLFNKAYMGMLEPADEIRLRQLIFRAYDNIAKAARKRASRLEGLIPGLQSETSSKTLLDMLGKSGEQAILEAQLKYFATTVDRMIAINRNAKLQGAAGGLAQLVPGVSAAQLNALPASLLRKLLPTLVQLQQPQPILRRIASAGGP